MFDGDDWSVWFDDVENVGEHFKHHSEELFLDGDWPEESPDLSILNAVWHHCDRQLKQVPGSIHELREAMDKAWATVSPESCLDQIYASMPDRCQAVIDADGAINDLTWWRNHTKKERTLNKAGARGPPLWCGDDAGANKKW